MSVERAPTEVLPIDSLQERREILLETTRECLEADDLSTLRLFLNDLHPADLAELLPHLGDEEQKCSLQVLAEPLAAATLAALDTPTMLSIAGDMDHGELSDLVEEMEPDDAADVLGDLPDEQSTRVLELMEAEEAEEVRELLAHEEDTGGGIMTSRLIAVGEEMTVADATARLREWSDLAEEIFYLYVVDDAERLLGTVSLRRLILADQDTRIRQLTDHDPIAVRADTDQEEIAHIFAEYNLPALPVVDEEGRLVGRVTVDDIVEVMEEEATEDIYVMAATSSEELEERSVLGVVRRRIPWLLVCLFGTLLSGGVLKVFHEALNMASLLLFVPAIMAMGGNTGIQTSTVTVRSLATGELQAGGLLKGILRELRIALVMGLILGVTVFVVTRVWTGALVLGGCVGLAMLAAIVLSAALGAIIPLFFRAIGVDPAVASGPLITTLNDALSLGIYFSIAAALLGLT